MNRIRVGLAALLLLTCVGAGVLSWRSRSRSDVFGAFTPAGHLQAFASHRGGFVVFLSEVPFGREKAWDADHLAAPAAAVDDVHGSVFDPTAVRRSLAGFSLASGSFMLGSQAAGYHAVRVPDWAVVVATGLLTLLAAREPLRRRRWARAGRCRQCGYDLRHSPERCPECGRPSTGKAGNDDRPPRRLRLAAGWRSVTGVALVAAAVATLGLAARTRLAALTPARSPDAEILSVHDLKTYVDDEPFWGVEAPPGPAPAAGAKLPPPVGNICFGRSPEGPEDVRVERVAWLADLPYAVPAGDEASSMDTYVLGDRLVLRAPVAAQTQFAQLLQALRTPAGAAFTTIVAGERAPVAREVQDAEAKLDLVLPEVRFDDVTLEAAVEQLRDAAKANLVVDWGSLESAGVEKTARVKLRLWDVPLGGALDVLLAAASPADVDPPLGFRVDAGVIRIANRQTLDRSAELRIYDVRPLILRYAASADELKRRLNAQRAAVPPTTAPLDDGEGRTREEITEEIATFLREEVDPDTWRDNGGTTGTIREWAGRLIIGQTPENHRKVEEALKLLHDSSEPINPALGPPPATAPAPVRSPRPPRTRGQGLFGG